MKTDPTMRRVALTAGALYLTVIAAGLTAEFAIRQPLIVPGDAAATAARILANEGLFRAGFALDAAMALADVALAVMLFFLFRTAQPVLATLAMVFRLVQAAILSVNLLLPVAALKLLSGTGDDRAALTLMDLQGDGYDLGLIFFGVNTVLMAALLFRAAAPRWLAGLMGAAGAVYLAGSFVRFLAPALHPAVEPAYLIPLAAELAFMGWLFAQGRRGGQTALPA